MIEKFSSKFWGISVIRTLIVVCVSMICIIGLSSLSNVLAEPVMLSSLGCQEPSSAEGEYYIDLFRGDQVIEKNFKITVIKEWEYDYLTVIPALYVDKSQSKIDCVYFTVELEREWDGWVLELYLEDADGEESSSYSAVPLSTVPLDKWDHSFGVGSKNHYQVIFASGLNMNLEVRKLDTGVSVKQVTDVGEDGAMTITDPTYTHDGVTDKIDFLVADSMTALSGDVRYDRSIGVGKVTRSEAATSDVTDEYKLVAVNSLDTVIKGKKVWDADPGGKAAVVKPGAVAIFRLTSSTSDGADDTVLIDRIYVKKDEYCCDPNILKLSLDGKKYVYSIVTKGGNNISAIGSVGDDGSSACWTVQVTGFPISSDAYTDFSIDNIIVYKLQEIDPDGVPVCAQNVGEGQQSDRCYTFQCDGADIITFNLENGDIIARGQDQWVGNGKKRYISKLQSLEVYPDTQEEGIKYIRTDAVSANSITVPSSDKITGEFKLCVKEICTADSYTLKSCAVKFAIRFAGIDDVTYSFEGLPYNQGFSFLEH